jgi:hypothetical protein
MYVPCVTEIYVSTDNDEKALETINSLDPESLSWKLCEMTPLRQYYEVVKSSDKKS